MTSSTTNNNTYSNTNCNSNTTDGCSTGNTSKTATGTCTEYAAGTTFDVNALTSPGCYVCNWNGSLLRVSDTCFSSSNFTGFNFTCSDTLTVTYLTNDPTATTETCRSLASSCYVYTNF